jgi:hypothetical protein
MNITPHVTLENLTYHPTAVRLKIVNVPPDDMLPNLMRLSALIESIHELLGGKIAFLSGYRCDQLQSAMVRQGRKSVHTDGRGVDFLTPGMDLSEAFDLIHDSGIEYDTLILANNRLGNNWIEITIPKAGEEARRISTRNQKQGERVYLA